MLQIAFNAFYHTQSTADKCTLYSDRNLINRRNVVTDVKTRVSACKQFFNLSLDARVTAAALEELGMADIDELPSEDRFPYQYMVSSQSDEERKKIFYAFTQSVLKKFIICNEGMEDILTSVPEEHKAQAKKFKCSFPGCPKTFVHDGKLKKQHKATHQDQTTKDDMFDYQSAFLEYGMLLRNFTDAISEGDGDRVVRCWKFFLLYLKNDGSTSRKYALEALYLPCQVKAILSPSAAYRLVWNRFFKSKHGTGGNIPIDLSNEHFNRILKTVTRNIGHNAANPNVLAKYCMALPVTKESLDNWDREALLLKDPESTLSRLMRKT